MSPWNVCPSTTMSIEPGSSLSSLGRRGSFATSAGCIRFWSATAASFEPFCAGS